MLELEAEVDIEVGPLGEVAPTQWAAQGADNAIVVVGELGAPDGLVVKDAVQFVVLLGDLSFDQHVVLLVQALLHLETGNQHFAVHGMAMAKAGERQLLLVVDA